MENGRVCNYFDNKNINICSGLVNFDAINSNLFTKEQKTEQRRISVYNKYTNTKKWRLMSAKNGFKLTICLKQVPTTKLGESAAIAQMLQNKS